MLWAVFTVPRPISAMLCSTLLPAGAFASSWALPPAHTPRIRHYAPSCFFPLDDHIHRLSRVDPSFSLGLPSSEDDLSEIASIIVHSFGTPPSYEMPVDESLITDMQDAVPDELVDSPHMKSRWEAALKGLHWRLGTRVLEAPSVSASLENGLLLTLRDNGSGALIGCAELSLRPTDGTLADELALPPLFTLHEAGPPLGAHLSNMAVLPSHRRRGCGSSLLRACEWIVRTEWRLDYLHLHLNMESVPARRLYASFEPLPQFDDVCRPIPPLAVVAPPASELDPGDDGQRAEGGGDISTAAWGASNRFYRKRLRS